MKGNLKKFTMLCMAAVLAVGLTGCGGGKQVAPAAGSSEGESITGSGSSALLPLVKDGAEYFKKKNPQIRISLNAGGSGMGLKQVAEGSVDMGNSDVPAESKLPKEQAAQLEDHKICVMTVATIVNKDVAGTVKSLTKQQLTDVFTAKVTNWKELGGPDEPIVLVTRPKTSGTRPYLPNMPWREQKRRLIKLWKPITAAFWYKAWHRTKALSAMWRCPT